MKKEEMLRRYFPYVMQQQDDGSWVLLNREYKPVGMNLNYSPWIKYEDYPVRFKLKKGLLPSTIAKLSKDGNSRLDSVDLEGKKSIHFYDDRTVPTATKTNMLAYLEKLEILMHLELEIPSDHAS